LKRRIPRVGGGPEASTSDEAAEEDDEEDGVTVLDQIDSLADWARTRILVRELDRLGILSLKQVPSREGGADDDQGQDGV
jgi:hypothetical protein